MKANAGTAVKKYDSWVIVTIAMLIFYALFMIYPLFTVMRQSVFDSNGVFTLENFAKFFNSKTQIRALTNSFKLSITCTIITLVIGVPLAYFLTCYKIKGAKIIRILIILCSMSAPFVGAYAWIVLMGNNGLFTNIARDVLGFKNVPSIYGFGGTVFVMSTNLFTLVYLYLNGALKNIDNSLLEASENLGVSGFKRFFKVVIPLCMPTILAAALLVFMRAFADFGTPLMIGRNFSTFTVLIYDQYVGEVSTDKAYASALSVIAIVVTTVFFLVQKYANSKFNFTMSALHSIEQKKAKPIPNFLMHLYCYIVIFIAFLPQVYVIYTSFRKTSGKIFVDGYSLESYKVALDRYGNTIPNTIFIGVGALVLIIFMSILIAYLVVRRKNTLNQTLDIFTMLPYIIPGSVVGVALIVAFNKRVLFLPTLTGTVFIMMIALIIRRSPYTIRSSVAILQQIPMSIEEASISLGASKTKTFFTVTLPMMMNGVISGAILSWVAIITELSTAIYLYTMKTMTMTLATYTFVMRGNYGYAGAMATILTIFTSVSLAVYTIITKNEGNGMI